MGLTRTTELEAINAMLSAIGEAPVNSLEASSVTQDVSMAQRILTEVSREVQSHGWNFNRETEVPIVADNNSNILLPTNAARIDVEPANAGTIEYIQRGGKLYNKTDQTYTITGTLKCTVVYMLDWEDLPQTARHYIMIRAARRYQDRVVGSSKHHDFNQQDEFQALVAFKDAETEGGDYTIFDNYDIGRIIDRGDVRNGIST